MGAFQKSKRKCCSPKQVLSGYFNALIYGEYCVVMQPIIPTTYKKLTFNVASFSVQWQANAPGVAAAQHLQWYMSFACVLIKINNKHT